MKTRQYLILLTSIAVWSVMVKVYVLLFISFSLSTAFIGRMKSKRSQKIFIILYISLIFVFFFSLKESLIRNTSLPLGYSVFAFSSISYLIDQYRSPQRYTTIECLCYLLFFPKAFAGPIEKTNVFVKQMRQCYTYKKEDIYISFKIIIFATFCKYVIANSLYLIDCSCQNGINAILSVGTYALAFYFDFYAYSLYAIGIARLFEVKLSDSFNFPYKSHSFKDFWHRWNITLSKWLKDYVYIPLGGSKASLLRTQANIFIVFIISAMWHGLSIPFILWGISHAILISIEKLIFSRENFIYRLFVISTAAILWQLFRVDSIENLFSFAKQVTISTPIDLSILVLLLASCILTLGIDTRRFTQLFFNYSNKRKTIIYEVASLTLMITAFVLITQNTSVNFFYMRF